MAESVPISCWCAKQTTYCCCLSEGTWLQQGSVSPARVPGAPPGALVSQRRTRQVWEDFIIILLYWVFAALRASPLRALVFLSSLTRKTGRRPIVICPKLELGPPVWLALFHLVKQLEKTRVSPGYYWVFAAVRARPLRALVFLGSSTRKTGRRPILICPRFELGPPVWLAFLHLVKHPSVTHGNRTRGVRVEVSIRPLDHLEGDRYKIQEAEYGGKILDGGKIREKLFRNKNFTTKVTTKDPYVFIQ